MNNPIISFHNVSFSYEEGTPVLKNIDLEIKRGSFTAILGHNGCGKSTAARLMNGLLVPVSGEVLVDGINTAEEEHLLEVRSKVGMVFQNPDNQIVANVVEEDVAFALENLGVPSGEIRRRVDDALRLVGMSEFTLHAPHLLSGGQKQRVAIAGVIAMQPDCIVLDEPTAMLDPVGRREVLETLQKLNRENGITIVLITHHMDEAALADRLIVMHQGKIVRDAEPRVVFRDVEGLGAIGLTVPETVRLVYMLKKQGCSLSGDCLSEEECAEALAAFLNT